MALLTTVTYYHFIRAFFNESTGKMVYMGYAAFIGFTIYVSQGGMLKSSFVINGAIYNELDATSYILSVIGAAFVFAAVFRLLRGLLKATDALNRNAIGYLLLAVGVWMAFAVTNFVPAFKNYSVDHIGNIAVVLIISYAIQRYQLFDLKLLTRRVLAFLLLIVSLAAVYATAVWLGYTALSGQPFHIIVIFGSVLAAVLSFMAFPLRRAFQVWVDRFFYREAYAYRQALRRFNSRMGNIINLNELADEMLPTIGKALRAPHVKLLLQDINTGDFTIHFFYPKEQLNPSNDLKFSLDNPFVAWLEKESSPLDLKQIDGIPQFKGLWQTELEQLVNSNLKLLCPIKSRGKLIGILAIARKSSGVIYLQEDLELVMSMANQAGVIIENARMFDSLKKQQERVEQLLSQTVFAQEKERERISAELHDSVAQWLAAASYRTQTVSALISENGSSEARKELTEMEDTIDKSLKELRRIVIGLRPPVLDELGLTHALRQSLQELKHNGLNCKFSVIGEPVRLPSNVEIVVYRAVQEALTNVRKHANATRVNLRLRYEPDMLLVEVRDNGRGFDLSKTLDSAIPVGHMGLLGMKQRAETLGGDIKIKTGQEAGTTITLSLPILSPVEEG